MGEKEVTIGLGKDKKKGSIAVAIAGAAALAWVGARAINNVALESVSGFIFGASLLYWVYSVLPGFGGEAKGEARPSPGLLGQAAEKVKEAAGAVAGGLGTAASAVTRGVTGAAGAVKEALVGSKLEGNCKLTVKVLELNTGKPVPGVEVGLTKYLGIGKRRQRTNDQGIAPFQIEKSTYSYIVDAYKTGFNHTTPGGGNRWFQESVVCNKDEVEHIAYVKEKKPMCELTVTVFDPEIKEVVKDATIKLAGRTYDSRVGITGPDGKATISLPRGGQYLKIEKAGCEQLNEYGEGTTYSRWAPLLKSGTYVNCAGEKAGANLYLRSRPTDQAPPPGSTEEALEMQFLDAAGEQSLNCSKVLREFVDPRIYLYYLAGFLGGERKMYVRISGKMQFPLERYGLSKAMKDSMVAYLERLGKTLPYVELKEGKEGLISKAAGGLSVAGEKFVEGTGEIAKDAFNSMLNPHQHTLLGKTAHVAASGIFATLFGTAYLGELLVATPFWLGLKLVGKGKDLLSETAEEAGRFRQTGVTGLVGDTLRGWVGRVEDLAFTHLAGASLPRDRSDPNSIIRYFDARFKDIPTHKPSEGRLGVAEKKAIEKIEQAMKMLPEDGAMECEIKIIEKIGKAGYEIAMAYPDLARLLPHFKELVKQLTKTKKIKLSDLMISEIKEFLKKLELLLKEKENDTDEIKSYKKTLRDPLTAYLKALPLLRIHPPSSGKLQEEETNTIRLLREAKLPKTEEEKITEMFMPGEIKKENAKVAARIQEVYAQLQAEHLPTQLAQVKEIRRHLNNLEKKYPRSRALREARDRLADIEAKVSKKVLGVLKPFGREELFAMILQKAGVRNSSIIAPLLTTDRARRERFIQELTAQTNDPLPPPGEGLGRYQERLRQLLTLVRPLVDGITQAVSELERYRQVHEQATAIYHTEISDLATTTAWDEKYHRILTALDRAGDVTLVIFDFINRISQAVGTIDSELLRLNEAEIREVSAISNATLGRMNI